MSTYVNEAGADGSAAGGQQPPLIDPRLSTSVNLNPGGYEDLHKKTKGNHSSNEFTVRLMTIGSIPKFERYSLILYILVYTAEDRSSVFI